MNNILELKTVNELQEYNFYIPSYQRGYRWTSKEVLELLNDISNFTPRLIDELTDEKTWYCLQPIVIRELEESKYEVIDGQQRLTTIYLILHYLNQDFVEARRDKLFSLDYETRTDSKDYLLNLVEEVNEENIDFYYISNAYKTISGWFEDKDPNFDKGNFRSKFKFNSKVIWYLSKEIDSISIFTRINIGKIPLTNSELIKALFLNSSNFNKENEKLRLRQLEIATEWDNIENSLQDNKFWYFLNQNNLSTNRIEFIFNLMNDDPDVDDNYSTFRFFSEKFINGNNEILNNNWQEVKRYFQRFNEWFNERELYHKIGFLISIDGVNIKDLYLKSDEMTKSEFKSLLDELIKSEFKNIDLSELQYSDTKEVRKVLLLYNILTMLSSSQDNSYFPFDLYKKEKWDIEHIASVKDKMPEQNKDQWLNDAIFFIGNKDETEINLRKKITSWESDDDEFKEIFEEIVTYFNSELNTDDDINSLSNLTLLDSSTNRSYKNAVFPFKRKIIIDRDKQGVFIPICTKNVFLKYFSEYPPKISLWSQEDRENYETDLFKVLNAYLENNDDNRTSQI
ncbi:DUF262 domain-containing protein [Elizabethkingia anophelis]|uniref:DUF262 domain-containing protein n=1 Tax=Elizabethkingia anophelis TaxID=1117645 RepID=UPI0013661B47|nr:DUF262 domain-containing protein [Elizabethkingia anophelis]MVW83190.1 DUF262 domain-containing protein [Elizabethkingia anophelis]HAT3994190.1 DUF262 domain-containing protein [Elizabethkingia anophelis]HAT3998008.1 DUF262 domain-containing protein [Elizabethkingia anophelis]HAT4005584.1 DUF262 domain-containing protein [Elizabethkingia anophelis]